MITMARIQGSAMGYAGFQKPIIQLGQEASYSAGPIGAGLTPGPGFNGPADLTNQNFPNFQYPGYPPNTAFLTQEVVPPTPAPASAPIPTWAIVGMSVVAGAIVAGLVMKNQ